MKNPWKNATLPPFAYERVKINFFQGPPTPQPPSPPRLQSIRLYEDWGGKSGAYIGEGANTPCKLRGGIRTQRFDKNVDLDPTSEKKNYSVSSIYGDHASKADIVQITTLLFVRSDLPRFI